MNVEQLIEALREHPPYRPVFVDGKPVSEVTELWDDPVVVLS